MRSLLIVPIESPPALRAAADCGADALALDLTIEPARSAVLEALAGIGGDLRARAPQAGLYARLDPRAPGLDDEDIAAWVGRWCDGILQRKTIGGTDIQRVGAKLAVVEAQADLSEGSLRILAMAGDSARGLLAIGTLPGSSTRLAGIGWNAGDLVEDLGGESPHDADGGYAPPYRHARVMTRLTAAAAAVPAIDTAYGAIADLEGLEQECRRARRDGFGAKLAIHPSQVPVINAVFGSR